MNIVDASPISVVLFGGAYFEPSALRFLVRIHEHAAIAFVGAFCQGEGKGLGHRIKNLVRRRHLLAVPILAVDAARALSRLARRPAEEMRFRRRAAKALARVEVVRSIHAPEVLERVRALAPDLGLIYGSPILKPELFEIPRFGTLGIHHGKVPEYRGKKTTFWAMYNGERSVGVTIQRVNAGLDRGEIVREGEVPAAGKSYFEVEAGVEELGIELYLDAILAIRRGESGFQPQRTGSYPLYRQPSARDLLSFWLARHAPVRPRTRAV